ncbi:hypothetical protein OHC33_005505 [Knufia fluminis]|uniref:Ubiquitin-like protease family profile domain-containing protein n=1 Tax=Knufia fluminis TaxID=191047 RepID=A0AAN8F8Z6_9EURO|nr:hypothetical protein OHC33_005505 [Knufia fluminis]
MISNALSDSGSFKAVYNNVLGFILGPPAESKPSPEIRSRSLSEEQPRAIPSANSTSSPMHSNVQAKIDIANRLFAGTGKYDPIELDHDDEVQEVTAPTRKGTQSSAKHTLRPPRHTETQTDKNRSSRASSEEARILGSAQRNPADAVLIDIPTNKSDMSFEPRRKTFTAVKPARGGGLRPMNTLGAVRDPRGTFQSYQYEATRKQQEKPTIQASQSQKSPTAPFKIPSKAKTSASQRPQTEIRSTPTHQGRNADMPPYKRRKLQSPSDEHSRPENGHGTSSRTTREQSRGGEATRLDSEALASSYGFQELEASTTARPTNGVKHTPLRDLESHNGRIGRRVEQKARAESPDELMDPPLVDDDKFENFTKIARQQRLARRDDTDEDQDVIMTTRPSPRAGLHADTERKSQQRRPLATITPMTSKIAARLDAESPDELSVTEQASKPARRPLPSSPIEQLPPGSKFKLQNFVCLGFPEAKDYEIEVFRHNRTFSLKYHNAQLTKDALINEIPLSKVISMTLPDEGDKLHVVMLRLSQSVLTGNTCFLEFVSEKIMNDYAHLMIDLDSTIKTGHRPVSWLENAIGMTYATSRGMSDQQKVNIRAHLPGNDSPVTTIKSSVIREDRLSSRVRLKDSLDSPVQQDGVLRHQKSPKQDGSILEQHVVPRSTQPSTTDTSSDRQRQTRARTTKQDAQDVVSSSRTLNLDPRRQGPEWKTPLMYPPDGAKRESVTWDDLARLEDDEFLNDSLVGLFIRYLQHRSAEKVKKMHFFNTFFYEKLTQSTSGKGRGRQINYAGVANWTKNVNIFQRDYVVVPVNESAHWYVMIICNLSSLKKEVNGTAASSVDIPASANDHVNGSERPHVIVDSDVVPRETLSDDELPEPTEVLPDSTRKKRTGHKRAPPLRRYDIGKPVIITLDSLNLNRSPTATVLKEYLIQEAKEKYQFEIDIKDISGMTAKNIPLQGNFSDCGLYLCMYLEQFLRDPQTFATSLLQRDADAIKWPKRLASHALRQRLYEMLQELYMAQQKKQEPNLPPIGGILIKDEDFLTDKQQDKRQYAERVQHGLAFYHNHSSKVNNKSGDRIASEHKEVTASKVQDHHGETVTAEHLAEGDTSAIVIEDDSQRESGPRHEHISPYFPVPAHRAQPAEHRQDTPLELAATLRQQRSPERSTRVSNLQESATHYSPEKPSSSATTAIDLSTPTQEHTTRRHRSVSVNTGFLSGNDSYDMHAERAIGPNDVEQQKAEDTAQPEEEVFEGFGDDPAVERQQRRHSSVVPESDYGDERTADTMQVDDPAAPDEMLLE